MTEPIDYDWEKAWEKPEPQPVVDRPQVTVNGASAYGKAALNKELAILANCGPDSHKRNHQLNISAFKLSQLVAAGHLPEKETWEQLRATVLRNGLPVGETDGTLRSAFRAGLQQPRVVPELKPKIHSAWAEVDGQRVNTHTGEVTPPAETPQTGEAETDSKKGRFTVRTFAEIQRRTSTWLIEGVLPDDDLTVFIGEEGIGKGLFSADVIARVTRAGHNVLIIATEDDFERVLGPRLDVAGADISRCLTMLADPDTLQGQPNLPHNRLEVEAVVNEYKVRLVYIDPWVSSVSGGLRLQNTQDARSAIDPLLSMARAAHCSVLAVAHPNRGEGDLRARVGLSAVLRQAARLLLFAIEPPDDDTKLIIGIEKANETGRAPATVYRKLPKKHPELPKPVWAVEEITDAPRLTIRQWHDQYRTDRDHRRSDRWPSVLAAAKDNLVQRADIITIYEESGSDQGAADKAINRWLKAGRLVKAGSGVYELPNG